MIGWGPGKRKGWDERSEKQAGKGRREEKEAQNIHGSRALRGDLCASGLFGLRLAEEKTEKTVNKGGRVTGVVYRLGPFCLGFIGGWPHFRALGGSQKRPDIIT
jgi:hypothetical protein